MVGKSSNSLIISINPLISRTFPQHTLTDLLSKFFYPVIVEIKFGEFIDPRIFNSYMLTFFSKLIYPLICSMWKLNNIISRQLVRKPLDIPNNIEWKRIS